MSRMLVTPELARLWLSKNDGNRPIDERRVQDFEEDMLAGRWRKKGGIPIIITSSGELRNGQHRLTALVRANCSIEMQVCVRKEEEK